MILRVGHTPGAGPRSERGAATVELVGVMFVVSMLIVGVAGRVSEPSSLPQTVWWGVCRAFSTAPGMDGLQCGDDPSSHEPAPTPDEPDDPGQNDPGQDDPSPQDRADDLSVPCIASQTNRTDNVHAVVYGIRVGEGGADEIRINADGTATVTLSQTTEAGVEAGIGSSAAAKGSVYGVVNGELKYTYQFPDAQSAQAFLDERRDMLNRIGDAVLPGKQTLDELSTRLGNWLQENVTDKAPWTSDAERARNAQERANNTADAVSIAVGSKASANGKLGQGQIRAQAEFELSAKGEALVWLDSSKGSSFTGTVEGKLSGGVSAQLGDPKTGIGALFGVSAVGGAKGSYKVVFDSDGRPTQLVVTGEVTGQAIGDATAQAGNVKIPAMKGGVGGIHTTTWTLDLNDPANRAAFDKTFTVGSVSAGDYTGAVALPNLSMSPAQIAAWVELQQRIAADSYEANYDYVMGTVGGGGSDKDYDAKAGVFGGGVNLTATSRILVNATGYDHRTGGPTVPLSTCQ